MKTRTNYFGKAGLISKLTFWYIFPLLCKKKITMGDMQSNLDEYDAKFLGDQLALAYEEVQGSKNRLLSALTKIFGNRFYAHGLLGFFRDAIMRTMQFILLGRFIRSFNEDVERLNRYIYGGSLILSMFIYCVSNNQYVYTSRHLSVKMRVAISELVYRKCLKVSQRTIAAAGMGKITNFLASDVAMFYAACQFAHYVWIAPTAALLAATVIWRYVGVAAIAGIAISILLLPLQLYTFKLFGVLRSRIATSTDSRLRLINEILNGVLLIKMSNWEDHFTDVVGNARAAEMDLIRLRSLGVVTVTTLLQVSPRIALFATLVIYVLQGSHLDAETAFVTLALFNGVSSLMTQKAPWAILYSTEAYISTQRIDNYLGQRIYTEENDFSSYRALQWIWIWINAMNNIANRNLTPLAKTQLAQKEFLRSEEQETEKLKMGASFVPSVHLDRVSTKWNDEGEKCLRDLSLDSGSGKFTCLLGTVGAGKSSLLLTILGETMITSGRMRVEGSLAYTAQSPCLFSGTVRENILFGNPWNPEWYDQVVAACALNRDFELLPYGDKTLVADKGVTLSGGQRARISLARAVYRDADIYLLDDTLSSVDASVGRHLSEHVIHGLLKTKCVILATHLSQHARGASEVILLDKGNTQARGSFEELTQKGLIAPTPIEKVDYMTSEDDEAVTTRKDVLPDPTEPASTLEQSGSGTVGLGVAWKFLRVGNGLAVVSLFICLNLLNQAILTYSDFFVKTWTTGEERKMSDDAWSRVSVYYVVIYAILMVPLILVPFLTNVAQFEICRRSSMRLHHQILYALIRAPMGFFERNAMGRILNRFSKDMQTTDITIPNSLSRVIQQLLASVAVFVSVCLMMPILVLPALLVATFFYFIRNFYLRAATIASRFEATSKSPVFSHVSTTLNSLSTIRAYKAQEQFERQFNTFQNKHSSVDFTKILLLNWFLNVVQFLSCAFFATATLSFMFIPTDPAAVGLAMSTALSISAFITVALNQSAELENNLVSVVRILEYTKVRAESSGGEKSIGGWPFLGGIEVHSASVSYIPGKDVLHGITCTFHPGEKIGIVGRTGAGKTTLVAALFRIVNLNSGMIHVDGIDISKVDRQELRSKIAIIPQDPILFSGTLRKNLDPVGQYDEMTLVRAIFDAKLSERVSERGLDTEVGENGANFSQGERQLISIARALLKKSKILILDEATAHVDASMDSQIQSLVKDKFRTCTVLTIAHRLDTILDSNRVCVMEAGEIIEFDSPAMLLKNPESRLSDLVKKSKNYRLRK